MKKGFVVASLLLALAGCSRFGIESVNVTKAETIPIFGGVESSYDRTTTTFETSSSGRYDYFFFSEVEENYSEIGAGTGIKIKGRGDPAGGYLKFFFGLMGKDMNVRHQDTDINFHLGAGVGLERRIFGCDWSLGTEFTHFSNGNWALTFIPGENYGVNTMGISLGVSCYR